MPIKFLLLAAVMVTATAVPVLLDEAALPLVNHALINAVNGDYNSTWKAGVNERFSNWTVGQMRKFMGYNRAGPGYAKLPKIQYSEAELAAVPDQFDPRVSRPACTGPVLDQGFCGSCWAFGAVEAVSDRYCMSRGANSTYIQLSPLDLVACNGGEDGCDGGMLEDAWQYIDGEGLVTEECYPYLQQNHGPVPTCKPDKQPCLPESKFIQTPVCNIPDKCPRPVSINNIYQIGVDEMKAELVNKGPVESAFSVYADFPNYKSGVYQHKTGALLGGHAIKVVGYGVDGGTPYWLVQNSWTTTWGDEGYFKIRMGTNECGIEEQFIAGDGF